MPLVQGRKRGPPIEEEPSPEPSPEPSTQRRRLSDATAASDDDGYGDDDGANPDDGNLDQMVKKMVRLALACEHQRRPIRRADVSEKVLGSAGRKFKAVFERAQVQLRLVFGMQMVELPAKDKITLAQRRAAQKSQSQGTKAVASWILVSVLPPQFRHPDILPVPAISTCEDESRYTAIYTLVVSLIALSGGALPDSKLERCLRRVGVEDNTPIDGFEKTEKLFKRLEKDGYIVKVKESSGTGDADDVSWTVGPRGKVEVGDDGVKGLARTVYGEMESGDEEELERRMDRSLRAGETPPARSGAAPNGSAPRGRGRKKKDTRQEQEVDEEDESGEDDEDEDEE